MAGMVVARSGFVSTDALGHDFALSILTVTFGFMLAPITMLGASSEPTKALVATIRQVAV